MKASIDENMSLLLRFRDAVGHIHGSEDLCILLYSLVKREKPKVILELGTGLGVTAAWIGRALAENGVGHLWTTDDGRFQDSFLPQALQHLREIPEFADAAVANEDLAGFLRILFQLTGVTKQVSCLDKTIDLNRGIDDLIPDEVRAGQKIDMLFSDYAHAPGDILDLLGLVLPHMAEYSSIFIDSASTYLLSYFMLEQVVDQLNAGKLPHRLTQGRSFEQRQYLLQMISERRFQLVHLFEDKDRAQNSTTWLRLAPVQWSPPPTARVR